MSVIKTFFRSPQQHTLSLPPRHLGRKTLRHASIRYRQGRSRVRALPSRFLTPIFMVSILYPPCFFLFGEMISFHYFRVRLSYLDVVTMRLFCHSYTDRFHLSSFTTHGWFFMSRLFFEGRRTVMEGKLGGPWVSHALSNISSLFRLSFAMIQNHSN